MIILDDIAAALLLMPEGVAHAIAPEVAALRDAVITHARTSGFEVTGHDLFSAWVDERTRGTARRVSLDPMLGAGAPDRPFMPFSAHRYWSGDRLTLRAKPPTIDRPSTSVILVDDAAYTGGTLRLACERLAAGGVVVDRILVGVAKASALDGLGSRPVEAFQTLARGDILHLRDFCPLLPFSGRSIAERGPDARVAPLLADDGQALHLQAHPGLRRTLIDLNGAILRKIAQAAGEDSLEPEALVRLCPGVALPLASRRPGADPAEAFAILRS